MGIQVVQPPASTATWLRSDYGLVGKILEGISEEDANLLAAILDQSDGGQTARPDWRCFDMHQRKGALEDMGQCTSVLAKLYANELALGCANDDADVMQRYRSVRDALCVLRKTSCMDGNGKDRLMMDICEEMNMAIGPPKDGVYGKNEFNYKFRQMELELEANRQCP